MGLLNLLNPIEAIDAVRTIVKDLMNYRFYRKQIKVIEAAGIFKTKKMRVDWLCRVYYVVNLEPELQLATGDLIDLEKSRVFESVSKIQGIFADRNLTEIVENGIGELIDELRELELNKEEEEVVTSSEYIPVQENEDKFERESREIESIEQDNEL